MPQLFLLGNTVFRAFLVANTSERLAASVMTVLLGSQMHELTHNTLDLAWLGLLEAIPGISLIRYGGYVADHHSRRRIVLIAVALLAGLAGGVAMVSGQVKQHAYSSLLLLAFVAAVVRAFEDPAASGLEAQVVPVQHLLPGIALLATVQAACRRAGPCGRRGRLGHSGAGCRLLRHRGAVRRFLHHHSPRRS